MPSKTKASRAIASNVETRLYERVAAIIESSRSQIARSVNTAMVHAYWFIGREIVEVEQGGRQRAEYGDELMVGLATRLTTRFGKGFGVATLRRVRHFYLSYPVGSTLAADERDFNIRSTVLIESTAGPKRSTPLSDSSPAAATLFPNALGWSHYLILMRVQDPDARRFYEIEAAREGWSVRELDRQVASLLFERLAKSRNRKQVKALAKKGQEVSIPSDVIKDPFVLEFLQLRERSEILERDLERAIIDRIEEFLLEFGKGFCFVARQKRITLDGDHFYVDLVFYNRLLRSFVLVDLKIGKLTHQDLGQMQMYVNWFDRFQRAEHEQQTIGIVLCSKKNNSMVKITLPKDNEQILAASYQLYLPTEDELRAELEREREQAERALRLGSMPPEHERT